MSGYFDTEANEIVSGEYAEFSMAFKRLSDSISELKSLGSRKPVEALAKAAADFDSMVRAHFSREENVIYWFASLSLSKK